MTGDIQIPDKHYFTIGEVSSICSVPAHVLRYWEQEFEDLTPVRRRGKRRYYTRENVELVTRIMNLLYEKNFTINGARKQLKQNGSLGNSSDNASSLEPRQVDETIAQLKQVLKTLSSE